VTQSTLFAKARMTVSGTPGTGAITLNAAVAGYQTFAAAGITNGVYSSYGIVDGTNWEVGQGYYTSSGTTWTRSTILASSNSGSAISATSNAIVYLTALPSDMQTNVLISGGTIDGTTIGGTTAAAGTFTTIGIGTGTTQSELAQRSVISNFPVPTFRPTAVNTTIAVDIMPNGSATPVYSDYISWLDICDADVFGNTSTALNKLGLRTRASVIEIGSDSLYGGSGKPLVFSYQGAEVFRINGSGMGIGGVASFVAPLTLSKNVTAPLTNYNEGTPLAHFAAADGTKPIVLIDAYGQKPMQGFRRTDGTAASPTAIVSGDVLGQLQFGGWNGTAYYDYAAGMYVQATQNWSPSAQGACCVFYVTENNATSSVTALTLDGSGNVDVVQNLNVAGTTVINSSQGGTFTTLSASSTVSGSGFSSYLASPPAIGGTTPAAGTFSSLVVNADAIIHGMTIGQGNGSISSNTVVGQNALASNTTGSDNTAIGTDALIVNTTGSFNAAVGQAALAANTTGSYNTAIGTDALVANTTGSSNVAVGQIALQSNTTGSTNTAVGQAALYGNTTGGVNVAVGQAALQSNTTGSYNTAVGSPAMVDNVTGNYNTAVSNNAMYQQNATYNSALGAYALYDLGAVQTAGSFTVGVSWTIVSVGTTNFVAIGASSNTVGVTFTATGVGSGTGTAVPNNTNSNTAVGFSAGRGIISGANNTIIGANVTGLAANLTGAIILATGDGTIQADYNKTVSGKWTLPTANGGAITPAITTYTSGSGTYTVPTGCAYLKIRMVAGGGGGGGTTAGSAGGSTTFGTSAYSCAGGSGGSIYQGTTDGTSAGGAGGSAPSGTVGYLAMAGQNGATGVNTSIGSENPVGAVGGRGADTLLGVGGIGGATGTVSPTAGVGYGSGGGGYTTGTATAGGGGAGAYQEILITSPASSYAYSVGSGGAAGTNGGAGAGGCIIIEAH